MKIDDSIFCGFVFNTLPQDEMFKVEKQLIQDGEASVAVQANITAYEADSEYANEILGADIEETEKIISQYDRNTNADASIEEKVNQFYNQNSRTMNNMQISEEEVKNVKGLVDVFNASFNEECSLDDNLKNFYLTHRPGTSEEVAENVVKGLHTGVETFNSNLMKALSEEGFDYEEELNKLVIDKPLAEQYELYLNFLAALTTLNMDNMDESQIAEIENFESIREHLKPNCEVTEEMLVEVKQKIADALNNNTLCLGNIEVFRKLVVKLPEGDEAIETAIRGSEEDVKQKLIHAMATFISYENGDIQSLQGTEFTPEMAGVSAAMGVEQTNALNDAAAGKTTVDKVIHILKIIGGVALYTLLTIGSLILILCVAELMMAILPAVIGGTVVATIVSLVFAYFLISQLGDLLGKGIEVTAKAASRIFDVIVKTWREIVWPGIKDTFVSIIEWLRNLCTSKKVRVETVNPSTPDVVIL